MRDPYRCLQGGWVSFWDLISVLSLIVLDSTWRLMISYSSLGECIEASVTGEVSRRFHDPPPCRLTLPFVHSRPSHPIEGLFSMHRTSRVHLGGMQRTLTMEQVRWPSFDQFWAVFCGELLGDDVISWPCSFRGWNNTFRDLRALGLWTFMIGVAVPKNVYNTRLSSHPPWEAVGIFEAGLAQVRPVQALTPYIPTSLGTCKEKQRKSRPLLYHWSRLKHERNKLQR